MSDLTVDELRSIEATRPWRVARQRAAVTESMRLRRELTHGTRGGRLNTPRLPLEPLMRIGGFANYWDVARWADRSQKTVQQWARLGGVTAEIADELATRLDLHPCCVWDTWWEATAQPDDFLLLA